MRILIVDDEEHLLIALRDFLIFEGYLVEIAKSAEDALETSGINKEELDYVIVAHNFGDVTNENKQLDIVPSLAARVKHKLKIENPYAVAYDVPFGCPGWLQAIIQADYFIKSGASFPTSK